ncbi:MAG: ABC transporter ATP-binding protein [Candidatus Marinimicrobia bacterium]|nr:ABC transporter ATP-binding protein [Candidatus Neomarinimicrobiota bacterium]MBL7022872.1 ABC transporter ATP-binding protein [Candidatus Neomarinimicrobiota bacterium]MBL7109191.1 ABC transporter ATP-binding protein [Candidatus Neomarinimicrobiota bacterium]
MKKTKTIDYILGIITGMSIMLAIWACTSNPLNASYSSVQEVKVVNASWEPVKVEIVE